MNKCYWIIGQMCVGKTHYSKIIGEMLGLEPIHLDFVQGPDYSIIKGERVLIEGFTPHRNAEHLRAITEALKDYEVKYILIEPSYEQWKENCKPIIACPTDENPPNYSRFEYEAENNRLRELKPMLIIK